LNTVEAALHLGYPCLKVPATFGVITVFGSQKEARSIERSFTQHEQAQPSPKQEISVEFKKAIDAEGDFRRVALDPRVPDRNVCIGAEMSPEVQMELLQFLDKNSDISAWSSSDLVGGSKEVIEHKLQVNLHAKPKK
jgi:hypothetical protein